MADDTAPDHGGLTAGSADRAEITVPAAQLPRGATNPASPVFPDAENGTGDLRAKLIEGLQRSLVVEPEESGVSGVDQWYVSEDVVECSTPALLAVLADGLLAAGWRPPMPEPSSPSPWDAYVAAFRAYQETDTHGATAHPTAHHMHALEAALEVFEPCDRTLRSELLKAIDDPRGLGEAVALAIGDTYAGETFADPTFERGTEAALRVFRELVEEVPSASSPLPDSETEWGCRDRHGQVHTVGVENEAQARAMRSMTPVRREVGPWTEVQP